MTQQRRYESDNSRPVKVLFVCLGNICRSPAAEGVMRHLVQQRGLETRYEIDSAGTYGGHAGDLPDRRMRAAAARRGYLLNHRAQRVTASLMARQDVIIAMDDMNYDDLHELAFSPQDAAKVQRMAQYCRHHNVTYIPDPYYEGADGFEWVLTLLEDACEGLIDALEAQR